MHVLAEAVYASFHLPHVRSAGGIQPQGSSGAADGFVEGGSGGLCRGPERGADSLLVGAAWVEGQEDHQLDVAPSVDGLCRADPSLS